MMGERGQAGEHVVTCAPWTGVAERGPISEGEEGIAGDLR